MKRDGWKRLAALARIGQDSEMFEMPFGFDTRVVAAWLGRRSEGDPIPWSALLGGAVLCSAAIMLLSVALNFTSLTEMEPGPVAIADSALRMNMLP